MQRLNVKILLNTYKSRCFTCTLGYEITSVYNDENKNNEMVKKNVMDIVIHLNYTQEHAEFLPPSHSRSMYKINNKVIF